ncbi:MAG: glycosyltransferase family 4 protein [Chloroflexi bacterium]|nr:glycosyltransferase family 4 protein [Chloroflexota bacterium]
MRIGIDTQSTLGRKTGIGLYTAALLSHLKKVAGDNDYVEIEWGKTTELRTHERLVWEQAIAPARAALARVDVFHAPGFGAPLLRSCPVVLTVHDLIGLLFPQNLPPVSRFYWHRWLPFTVSRADRIIADSHHTKRDIVDHLCVPASRVEVVYLAAGDDFRPIDASARREEVRRRYGLPPRFILYVGTIEPRKGLKELVSAFARLKRETGLPHGLVIAGKKGWYWQDLFRLVEDLGVAVCFTDYVADADLPTLYSCADLFVFLSHYEGFGLPPLEAMACGTPVICSNASSLPEVVGDAALLVSPPAIETVSGAMAAVLQDPSLGDSLAQKGRKRAREFSWERAARETLAIYQKVGG